MKNLLWALSLLFLVSCTKSELKGLAVKEARTQFIQTLHAEVENVTMPGRLKDNYISFLKNTAKFEVVDIKMNGEADATVSIQMEAVPPENRKTLMDIASTLDPTKASNFNMGNAINLIEQQPGQIRGKKVFLSFLKFHNNGRTWQLVK